MRDASDLARARAEPELRDQLIHEDHETDRADEAAQERPTQDVVQEAQARDAGDEEEAAGQARHDTGRAGVVVVVVVAELAGLDVGSDDGAEQHRPGGLGSDDHLRAAPEQSVDQGVDDVRVQTVDGRDVREILGEGQGHGQVEGRHGEGRYDVAAQPRPAIVLDPGQQRQIVARVRGLAASAAGRPPRPRPQQIPEGARGEIHDRVSQDPAHHAIAPSSTTAACVMQAAEAHGEDILVLDGVRFVQPSHRARRGLRREGAMVAGSRVCGLVVPGLSFQEARRGRDQSRSASPGLAVLLLSLLLPRAMDRGAVIVAVFVVRGAMLDVRSAVPHGRRRGSLQSSSRGLMRSKLEDVPDNAINAA